MVEFKLKLEKKVIEAQGQPLMQCPMCGSYSVVYQGGCYTCLNCGWSKCDT